MGEESTPCCLSLNCGQPTMSLFFKRKKSGGFGWNHALIA